MKENINELDENEVSSMIFEKIELYWRKFPNIWKYTTKNDIASEVAVDLYRKRKSDGVPHIVHYFKTRGERSLKPLIGMLVYNNLVAEARDVHSTGIRTNEDRRNVRSPLSLDFPIMGEEENITLGDTVSDSKSDVFRNVGYSQLYDNIPNKVVENVYYLEGGKYFSLTYKKLLKEVMSGKTISMISENIYKKKRSGELVLIHNLGSIVKEMKDDIKSYIFNEYGLTEELYMKGWGIYD